MSDIGMQNSNWNYYLLIIIIIENHILECDNYYELRVLQAKVLPYGATVFISAIECESIRKQNR